MCGVSGFYIKNNFPEDAQSILKIMGSSIQERGPDSSGEWFDSNAGIGFSHRRLAILDLSDNGHQPMVSNSQNLVISFNGEIYNHKKIRKLIEIESDKIWRGNSDTETLLAAIEIWGVEKSLKIVSGMFAFALWNKKKKSLYLARDCFGEKPLYYGFNDKNFLFGSELKAIRSFPSFKGKINKEALRQYLRYSYVPSPYSIYEGIHKLEPGSILKFDTIAEEITTYKYWSSFEYFKLKKSISFKGLTEDEVTNSIEKTLTEAVKEQMISDVPLGAFLSGGVDSSLIVSLMQKVSRDPVKTFSIGFKSDSLDEAKFAKDVANHLRTDHRELYVSNADILEVVPKISDIYDEPFADSSQIPTYLVSRMAKEYVTVSLSGDAGDELFGGYNRHLFISKYWNRIKLFPYWLRQFLSIILNAIPEKYIIYIHTLAPKKYKVSNLKSKLEKFALAITSKDFENLYQNMISVWHNPNDYLTLAYQEDNFKKEIDIFKDTKEDFENAMIRDTLGYLPGDILVKVDRAAMYNSLETRIPFLNKEVFKNACSLPKDLKIKDNSTKHILRNILYKYVPQNLIDRPKAGFAVPLDDWLRGPLFSWANDLISEERLIKGEIFDPQMVSVMWKDHQSKKKNYQDELWNILMFQSWLLNHHDL